MISDEEADKGNNRRNDFTGAEAALLAALGALVGGEDLAKAMACKGSTRFGENLSREEMETLLAEWSATEFKDTNPRFS
jgi:DNA mismatch repair ATPase MutL